MFFSPYYLLALILILTLHEASHAWVALQLGDPTAQREGRVSLNPARHLSLLGTVMLFIANIGWGKPVPVNPSNFKNPKRDEALTAFAGPLANLLIAVVAAIPFSYSPATAGTQPFIIFSEAVMDLSLLLFIFNMLPFAPLDGATFLKILVPRRLLPMYEEFMSKALPYFVVLVVVDIYFLRSVLGVSFVWYGVSILLFWLKTSILILI